MKKTLKTILAMTLALVMLVSFAAPAFAATRENVKQYENMLIFGDSIASAYGLPTSENFKIAEGSYADIVSKAVGATKADSVAFCGCSITQVMYLLDMEYDPAELQASKDFLANTAGAASWDDAEQIKEGKNPSIGDLTERIQAANLITVQLGNNELATIPVSRATDAYETALKEGKQPLEAGKLFVSAFTETMQTGLDYFLNGYQKVVERLKEINPKATIVLVGAYNPWEGLEVIVGETSYAVGTLLSPAVKLENTILRTWALKNGCVFADVYGANDTFPSLTIEIETETDEFGTHISADAFSDTSKFDIMNEPLRTHPSYEGHAYMAEQIIKALPAAEKNVYLPRSGEVRLEQEGIDLGRYELKLNGIFWTIKDTETGLYLGMDSNKQLVLSEKQAPWLYDGGFFTVGFVKQDTSFGFSFFTLAKQYLTADEEGSIALTGSRAMLAMYVKA